jgi:hypothetical protein
VIEILAGQVICGATLSMTVTLKLHDPAAEGVKKPGTENSEHVTIVVPKGKNEPDAGLQIIPKQSPEVVGNG